MCLTKVKMALSRVIERDGSGIGGHTDWLRSHVSALDAARA